MMRRLYLLTAFLVVLTGLVITAMAQERSRSVNSSATATTATDATPKTSAGPAARTHSSLPKAARSGELDASERVEGEKRFRTNCGRCHTAPHKFPPRVMATAIRHMRVRAMITDEDMRLILQYMTE